MNESLSVEEFNEHLRQGWDLIGPEKMPTRMIVSPRTVETIRFWTSQSRWRRIFYWCFRAKQRRDLERYLADREVPPNTVGERATSGMDCFAMDSFIARRVSRE